MRGCIYNDNLKGPLAIPLLLVSGPDAFSPAVGKDRICLVDWAEAAQAIPRDIFILQRPPEPRFRLREEGRLIPTLKLLASD
jgi:hypothetical protein